MVIQAAVQVSTVDLNIRMCLVKSFQPFRSGNDTHEFDAASALFLYIIHSCLCGSAGCQHGIHDHTDTLINGFRKLAIILVRLMSHRITVKSHMTYFCRRNQGKDTGFDHFGMLFAITGLSAPGFWLGLMGIEIFSVRLGLLPTAGLENWRGYILPSLVMGTGIMAVLARYSRSSMLETLREDYVRTARAKGQKEFWVMFSHAFRNSLIQIITILGLQIGGLLSGSVITETIFSIPGLGRLLVDSIAYRDYPVIQGLLMIFALQYVLINLIVDMLYGVINPKIRYD